jgi:thymidylate synthase (FAD)
MKATIHTHGSIELLDTMPRDYHPVSPPNRSALDDAVITAARTSTGNGLKDWDTDRKLLRYLYRNDHMTPFEMVQFKFQVDCPIFVARQWIRYRAGSFNEFSGRYAEMPEAWYVPEVIYQQGDGQGSGDKHAHTHSLSGRIERENELSHLEYVELIGLGVSREQARMVLPLATYTRFVWSVNLRNLLHFLTQRTHHHAQQEIRDYANQIADWLAVLCPWTHEAWCHYTVNALNLSQPELTGIGLTPREERERAEKVQRIIPMLESMGYTVTEPVTSITQEQP